MASKTGKATTVALAANESGTWRTAEIIAANDGIYPSSIDEIQLQGDPLFDESIGIAQLQFSDRTADEATPTIVLPMRWNGMQWSFIYLLVGGDVKTGADPYCVDEETTILTTSGWKRYDELSVGEEVLTLNHKTGFSEWQSVDEVCVFPEQSRELVLMEGKAHSSLTTPNHRWPVSRINTNYTKNLWQSKRIWKTTETLSFHDRLILSAECADLPNVPIFSDDFVELVAWFYTEGSIRYKNGIRIVQSNKVNAEHVCDIEKALMGVFGGESESLLPVSESPKWRQFDDGDKKRFALNAVAGRAVLAEAPDKLVKLDFLRKLTLSQLELFIEISMKADNAGPERFGQKNRKSAEAFQFACILAGRATSLKKRNDQEVWNVTLRRQKFCHPIASASKKTEFSIGRITHDGIVWCPRTRNHSWLASRNGSVYFTGNTHTGTYLEEPTAVHATLAVGIDTDADGTVDDIIEWPSVKPTGFSLEPDGEGFWQMTVSTMANTIKYGGDATADATAFGNVTYLTDMGISRMRYRGLSLKTNSQGSDPSGQTAKNVAEVNFNFSRPFEASQLIEAVTTGAEKQIPEPVQRGHPTITFSWNEIDEYADIADFDDLEDETALTGDFEMAETVSSQSLSLLLEMPNMVRMAAQTALELGGRIPCTKNYTCAAAASTPTGQATANRMHLVVVSGDNLDYATGA